MSVPRSRREAKRYDKYLAKLAPGVCEFCTIGKGNEQFVSETNSFKLIHNLFPYSIWDGQRVVDHLLVVPKQHIDTLQDLTPGKQQSS